jgi:hypothetical protein
MKEAGSITRCMEKERPAGLMEKTITEITKTTNVTVSVHSAGQTDENT